uniref:Uncharacterized protein n=1 Tax=Anguilla anguilla TaxID=7936 RepID=A0A0E9WP72_ANGAN
MSQKSNKQSPDREVVKLALLLIPGPTVPLERSLKKQLLLGETLETVLH